MPSAFAKLLLVASSLAPVLGAIAVINIANQGPWLHSLCWFGFALFLVITCWIMLTYQSENAEKHEVHIHQFERTDQEILAFLLAYLLPFISTDNIAFTSGWLVLAYILGMISLVIAHVGAFHFNPVMWLLKYHFYAVKDSNGISHVLISRKQFTKIGVTVQTVRLAHNIYLHTGD